MAKKRKSNLPQILLLAIILLAVLGVALFLFVDAATLSDEGIVMKTIKDFLEDLEIESGFSGMDIVFGLTSNDIVVLQFSFVALIPLVLGVIGIVLNILSSKLLNLIGAVCLIGGAVMLIFVPNFIVYSETLQYMVDTVEKLDITPFVAGVGAYLGTACFGLAGIVSLGKALVTK